MDRLRVYWSVRFCNKQDSHATKRQVNKTECKVSEVKFVFFPDVVSCSWYKLVSVSVTG